mgnify:CR=1 FL=1
MFYDVIGRSAPVVATQPARLMEGQLAFRCADLTARNQLAAYLAAGYPLVLRTPWPNGADDVAFLASDDASFITASNFLVDGGISGAYVTPL